MDNGQWTAWQEIVVSPGAPRISPVAVNFFIKAGGYNRLNPEEH